MESMRPLYLVMGNIKIEMCKALWKCRQSVVEVKTIQISIVLELTENLDGCFFFFFAGKISTHTSKNKK